MALSTALALINGFTADELDDMAEKIYNFSELLCFAPPAKGYYPYQEEFAKAIVRDVLANLGNTLTGLFARQSGKSETVANIGATLMLIMPKLANMRDGHTFVFPQFRKYANGYKVGIFAPSNLQSSTTYGRLRERLTSFHAKPFIETPEFAPAGASRISFVNNKSDYLQLNNGSLCHQMSADKQSKIESKTFNLILLDESQDLDESVVNKSIYPMGASIKAPTVATGTPGTKKGFFYNSIEFNKIEQMNRRRSDYKLQRQLHFEYAYKTVQKFNPDYKAYVLKEKKRIGEHSDEFRMSYNLEWLLERGMAITKELFDDLTRKDLGVTTELKTQELVAGLDWGKQSDSTVLTIGRPLWEQVDEEGKCPVEVIYWWEKVGDDWETIFAEVKEKLNSYNVITLSVDATGVGEPLYNRLAYELPHIYIIPVKFSSQSKDHLYKWFLMMLQEHKVWWPGEHRVRQTRYFKNFEHQMLNLQKEYKGQYLTCHHPEDQKNAHDDYPDSLALMLWSISAEAMPEVQVSNGVDFNGYNWHDWTPGSRRW